MNTKSIDGLILLGPDFEEGPVIDCLISWRDAGLGVWLVGTTGIVRGQHGLAIRADRTLGELSAAGASRQLLIPGGQHCARSLLSDPRVHRLINRTLKHGGRIATLPAAAQELRQLGMWTGERFVDLAELHQANCEADLAGVPMGVPAASFTLPVW